MEMVWANLKGPDFTNTLLLIASTSIWQWHEFTSSWGERPRLLPAKAGFRFSWRLDSPRGILTSVWPPSADPAPAARRRAGFRASPRRLRSKVNLRSHPEQV